MSSFWVVEETYSNKNWYPLFREDGCCVTTKRQALERIKEMKRDWPMRTWKGEPVGLRAARYVRAEEVERG